jgi:hypothetical protein
MKPNEQQVSDKRLAEIRERRAKISPAPWRHFPPTDNEERRGELRRYVTREVGCGDVPPEKFFIAILHWPDKPERDIADAEFIAHAPSDIDYLLSHLDALDEDLECATTERDNRQQELDHIYASLLQQPTSEHEHDWYNDGDILRCYDCTETDPPTPVQPAAAEGQGELVESARTIAKHWQARDYNYAVRLARHLAATHFPDVADWRPLPDMDGVLSQIDNMICAWKPSTPTTGEGVREHAHAMVGTVFENTGASYETLEATMIERITDYLTAHFPPAEGTQVAVEAAAAAIQSYVRENLSAMVASRMNTNTVAAIISKHCGADAGEVEELAKSFDYAAWKGFNQTDSEFEKGYKHAMGAAAKCVRESLTKKEGDDGPTEV